MRKCFPTVDPQEKRRQTNLISWNSASWMMLFAFTLSEKKLWQRQVTRNESFSKAMAACARESEAEKVLVLLQAYRFGRDHMGSSIIESSSTSYLFLLTNPPWGAPDLPAASGFGVIQHRPGCMCRGQDLDRCVAWLQTYSWDGEGSR